MSGVFGWVQDDYNLKSVSGATVFSCAGHLSWTVVVKLLICCTWALLCCAIILSLTLLCFKITRSQQQLPFSISALHCAPLSEFCITLQTTYFQVFLQCPTPDLLPIQSMWLKHLRKVKFMAFAMCTLCHLELIGLQWLVSIIISPIPWGTLSWMFWDVSTSITADWDYQPVIELILGQFIVSNGSKHVCFGLSEETWRKPMQTWGEQTQSVQEIEPRTFLPWGRNAYHWTTL